MTEKTPKKSVLQRKVTFRLDEKRLEELETYAGREGTTVSFVVRHLVCRFLEVERRGFTAPQIGGQSWPQ